MHFDLTNFISGLTGALLGGLILWLLSLIRGAEPRDSSDRSSGATMSIILAAAFILGILIALYLLITGNSK
jgi:hypothetical protein